MIQNDQELEATKARLRYFQNQVEKLRQVETIRRIIIYRQAVILLKSTG